MAPIADATAKFTATIMGNIIQGNTLQVAISGSDTPVMIVVKDMNGKTIACKLGTNGSNTIQLGNGATGLQIVQISNGSATLTQKVIKL